MRLPGVRLPQWQLGFLIMEVSPPLPLTFLCSEMKVDDNCPLPPHFCLIKIKPQQPQLGVNSNLRDSIWGFLCKKNSFLLHVILWQIHNIHKMEVTVCSPPPKGSQILMSKKSKIESPSPSFSLFYACPKWRRRPKAAFVVTPIQLKGGRLPNKSHSTWWDTPKQPWVFSIKRSLGFTCIYWNLNLSM